MLIGLSIVLLLLAASPDERTDTVRDAALVALAEQYPDDAHRLDLRVRRIDATFDAEDAVRVVFPSATDMPRGTTRVSIFASAANETWTGVGWALLYVTHHDSVLVATTTLPANEPVTWEDLSMAWTETTRFPGVPLTPAAFRALRADGIVLAERTLREDRLLREDDVRRPYLANTGDRVVMQYQRGTLTFELTCKAREHGGWGDIVRLYSDDTSHMYRARLTGPGTAEWIETL